MNNIQNLGNVILFLLLDFSLALNSTSFVLTNIFILFHNQHRVNVFEANDKMYLRTSCTEAQIHRDLDIVAVKFVYTYFKSCRY